MIKILVIVLVLMVFSTASAENTTISDLTQFLDDDQTDKNEYLPWYTCGHFTRDLAKNASEYNISLGGAICGNHPVFKWYENHIINYIKINDTLYFIEPQTDRIMILDEVFMHCNYIRLYPDGTQVPTHWNCNLAPDISAMITSQIFILLIFGL